MSQAQVIGNSQIVSPFHPLNNMIDIVVSAIMQIIFMSLPFLLVGLLISTGIGFFQAVTQVQDATVSFVPKLILLLILLVVGMPWFLQMMTEYSRDLFQNITISTESL